MNPDKKISQNTVNKILSVIIAIILWIFVIGGENPVKERTIRGIPVNLKNIETLEDNNLAIAGDTEYTVDVKIKGQRTTVDPLTVDDITVEADLFGYGEGENYINVTAVIPDNTELVEIRSPKIQVNIEELIAVSKPVNINFANVPEGKEVGGLVIQPTEVEVSGARSLVNSVAWALGTVNVSGYREGATNTAQAELQPLNDGQVLVNNVRMSSPYAEVSYVVMDVKEVPLTVNVGEAGDDRILSDMEVPETIEIRGLAADLAKVDRVVTETVDLSRLETDGDGKVTAPLTVQLPDGVELASQNPALRGTFHLEQTSSATLEYGAGDIEIRNLPSRLEGEIAAGTYRVTVKGDDGAIRNLTKSDLVLFVNGNHAEAGDVSLEIQMEHSGVTADEIVVTPKTVTVRIREKEKEE